MNLSKKFYLQLVFNNHDIYFIRYLQIFYKLLKSLKLFFVRSTSSLLR